MDHREIDSALVQTIEDQRMSRAERQALKQLFADIADNRTLDVIRGRAFVLAKKSLETTNDRKILEWLEGVLKAVEAARDRGRETDRIEAWFSPGTDCRDRIVGHLNRASRSVDVCVFTISDNTLSRTILDAHRRGVKVRLITDDQKVGDLGSDAVELADMGVAVVTDSSPAHMHHKFAIIDHRILITGSFNWTRSATTSNHENIVVLEDPSVLSRFEDVFEKLWKKFQKSKTS